MIILVSAVILLAVAFFLLAFRVLLFSDKKFPNTHVGGNKAMRDRGISCHTSQHHSAQLHKNLAERFKENV